MSDRRQAPPPLSTASGEAARLRDAIDEGRLRDKVSVEDPAATPLGTDDEAGGAPPATRAAAGEPGWRISAVARSAEPVDTDRAASAPGRARERPGLKVMAVALALLVLLAILALAVFVPLPQRG